MFLWILARVNMKLNGWRMEGETTVEGSEGNFTQSRRTNFITVDNINFQNVYIYLSSYGIEK